MKWSRVFWIFGISVVVLIGGTAWLSAHRLSAPSLHAAREERAAGDLGSSRPRPGAPRVAPEVVRPSDTPPVAAGDPAVPNPPPSGTEVQPTSADPATGAPKPGDAPALEADEVAAPRPGTRPKDAPRVNPTSGELMWSARDVTPDGGRPDEPLCGGKVCAPGQFCCGPLACGRCAYPMAGPRCPSVCPGQNSN